jgi:hypothetical protein
MIANARLGRARLGGIAAAASVAMSAGLGRKAALCKPRG